MNRSSYLMLFVFLFTPYHAFAMDLGFSYKESIVFDYKDQFEHNGYFPSVDRYEKEMKALINPDYPSVHLYVDHVDLPYLLKERNKTKSIKVMGYTSTSTRGSILEMGQKMFFETMTLRGSMSLSCGKPSFSIEGVNIKLKGMCGSDFGLEEQVFSQGLVKAIETNSGASIPLYAPHTLTNLFVNDRFYGVYTHVPNFDREYLEFNGFTDVSQRNNCVLKIYKLITAELNPFASPILTTLNVIGSYDMQDVALLADVKYGRNSCYTQLNDLIEYLNNSPLGSVNEVIDKESVLYRGLSNWISQTLLSYEHNYIIALDHGRYSMGYWDNEAFHGCVDSEYEDYEEYRDQPHQNLLFSHVLRWYELHDPVFIQETMERIETSLCDKSVYEKIRDIDLPYILYDRYLWNVGHFTVLDFRDRVYNSLLYDIFYGKISFADYTQRMTQAFDEYFVSLP